MSRLGAASDLAKRNYFTNQLLYVQHVDKEKDTASTISEQSLRELVENHEVYSDSHFANYEKSSKANVGILKSYLQDWITYAVVFSNSLSAIPFKSDVTTHAFVVFQTENSKTNEKMCYSIEKNGQYIVLQQSTNENDVTEKLYDPEKKEHVQRLGPVKSKRFASGNNKHLKCLLRAIWKTNQLSTDYHFLFANCQHFASFVIEKASFGGNKWSTWISAWRNKKIKPEFEADRPTLKYNGRIDAKFAFYKAMAEGRRQDFEELAGNLTSESLNSVDSQGYTLLEWATVFSTSDWPIDQFLKGKGAKIQTDDERLFRRNVFFIALQYLPSKKESRYLSFDRINIHGVNQTGDSALHLALTGEKWDVAERILDQFPDYDVNVTNSSGHSPFDLAVQLDCTMILMKKILAQTSSENINKSNKFGETALHLAIMYKSQNALKELLKRDDVVVNLNDNEKPTALHYASWYDMTIDLFKNILEKTTDVNEQEEFGNTALHLAILSKTPTATKELLRHKGVDVNLKNDDNQTTLYYASVWKNIPINLFKIILEKSNDVNAQDKKHGWTALHLAIAFESENAVKKLLKHKDVDVNLKDNKNVTALHFAAGWEDMPIELFKLILGKSTNVNAKDENGNTALQWAIVKKCEAVIQELVNHKDVDVNLKNNKNQTALHSAARRKNIPIDLFTKILGKTTNVNAQDEFERTALHWVMMDKYESAVKELLKRKDVDVNLKDNENQTALYLACAWKNFPIDLFKVILEKSTDVNAQDKHGWTALHLAIGFAKSETMVKELLTHKDVGVDAQDKNGCTALHFAIVSESKNVVEELLKRKDVDVNVKDRNNYTAFDYCRAWKNIPLYLFIIIKDKATADIQAQNEDT
jgi:ankyrin repeat protein